MTLRRKLLPSLVEAIRRFAAWVASRSHLPVVSADQPVCEVTKPDLFAPVGVFDEARRVSDAGLSESVLENGNLNKGVGGHDGVTCGNLGKHLRKQTNGRVGGFLGLAHAGEHNTPVHATNVAYHGLEHAYLINDLP
jgi:hypothetical protein